MIEVRQTGEFRAWLHALRDSRAAARIVSRIRRFEQGNPGDAKPVGSGLFEMRVDHGPGYRVYFKRKGATIILLLCGGDKRTARVGSEVGGVKDDKDNPFRCCRVFGYA